MKIGDRVRFLNEIGGGRVAGFQGKNIVLVEDEDGFQVPMLTTEVVVVGFCVDTFNPTFNALIASSSLKQGIKKRIFSAKDRLRLKVRR